jgi:hypothetical protein
MAPIVELTHLTIVGVVHLLLRVITMHSIPCWLKLDTFALIRLSRIVAMNGQAVEVCCLHLMRCICAAKLNLHL